ncbi:MULTISPECIES: hypothetical protein [unclassified Halomonas]|uniref:hypothetical protein n=1 Tax=unclassified Halomonas TaxID=2609666 RepID=UPI0020766B93|nr:MULTISPECIES: hypothetical protein [unclassified Halomonas]
MLVAIYDTAALPECAPFLFGEWQRLVPETLLIVSACALLWIAVNTGVAKPTKSPLPHW